MVCVAWRRGGMGGIGMAPSGSGSGSESGSGLHFTNDKRTWLVGRMRCCRANLLSGVLLGPTKPNVPGIDCCQLDGVPANFFMDCSVPFPLFVRPPSTLKCRWRDITEPRKDDCNDGRTVGRSDAEAGEGGLGLRCVVWYGVWWVMHIFLPYI